VTDFGKRKGDMEKSTYDADDDGTVDDSAALEGEDLAEVQDHTPKTHTHTEAQITDLSHDAAAIAGVEVDNTDIGAGKGLYYNGTSEKLEYETPPGATGQYVDRGDPSGWDKEIGDFTTNNTWIEMDFGLIVPDGAIAIQFAIQIEDDAAGNSFNIRSADKSNALNKITAGTQAAGVMSYAYGAVSCSTARKVDYRASNTTWTGIWVVVCGWFL